MLPTTPLSKYYFEHVLWNPFCQGVILVHTLSQGDSACRLQLVFKNGSAHFAADSIASQKASDGGSSAGQKAPSSEAVTSAASQIAAAVNKAGECHLSA